jgi:tetratricopeptide (TPR) repeat protein
MNDLTLSLNEVIRTHFSQNELDILEIVQIPQENDARDQMKAVQELVDELAQDKNSFGYFLQVRPKKQNLCSVLTDGLDLFPQAPLQENIFLPNGKLNIPFLMKNAELLFASEDYENARTIYNAITKSGENTSVSLNRLGRCFEAEGKLEEARRNFEESIAYLPSLDSYQRLGSLLIRQNQDQLAAETLTRALNMKDLDSVTRFNLHKACGNCWTRAQKLNEAESHFKKALELDPSAEEIRSNLGALYLQSNRIPEAKRNFQDAIASNPRSHLAITGLGSCFLAEGNKKAAHDSFVKALEIELKNPTAIFYLVKCAYELKSYATAARIIQDYIQIAPVSADLLYNLAGLQFQLGRIREAGSTTQKILEIQPQHSGAKDLLNQIQRYSNHSV